MFDVPCALCGTQITEESQEAASVGSIISVAQMVTDTTFDYAISGVYEFTKDLGLKAGDSICNPCLKKHENDFQPSKTVTCDFCDEKYQNCDMRDRNDMGWGCSSEVYERNGQLYLCGHWGSLEYDASTLKVVSGLTVGQRACDKCICRMVDAGTLVFDSHYM